MGFLQDRDRPGRMTQSVVTVAAVCVILWSGVAFAHTGNGRAMLENPAPDSSQSGVSVISGWACEAEEIVIEIDDRSFTAAYGTLREDTQEACGDTDNGFSFLWNWNNNGDGEHTVRALSDGMEFGTATITVTTFGTPFLREVQGSYILDDFPITGEETRLQWAESLQNFVIRDNPAAFTQEFVQAALDRYDQEGREATLAYYNDPESIYWTTNVHGPWYMFIIDENALFVAHPVVPELIGQDVTTLVGTGGDEFGKEIALATKGGHWTHYRWPNPMACGGEEEPKHSWVIRHDGLIFGAGYYEPRGDYCRLFPFPVPDGEGIQLYSRVPGIAAALENPTPRAFRSGISAISGWACEAEEIVIEISGEPFAVYGTDSDGRRWRPGRRRGRLLPAAYGTIREDTAEVCGDTDNGFSLLWNWNNLGDGVYTVRALLDGVPFAQSSVTVTTFGDAMLGDEEKAAFTQEFVQAARDRYDRDGREATLAYHNSSASIEGEWYVFIIDENDLFVAHPIMLALIGQDVKTLVDSNGYEFGKEIAPATKGGHWIHYLWPRPAGGGVEEPKHVWVIRHDGLIFGAGYYGPPNFQEYELVDFPTEGSKLTVQWSHSLQNFVITDVRP